MSGAERRAVCPLRDFTFLYASPASGFGELCKKFSKNSAVAGSPCKV